MRIILPMPLLEIKPTRKKKLLKIVELITDEVVVLTKPKKKKLVESE